MSKLLPALVLCIAFTGCKSHNRCNGAASGESHIAPLVADPHAPLQRKLNGLAAQVDAITTVNVHDHLEGKSAPHLKHNGFTLSGDFLYWKAHEDGLEYATRVSSEGQLDPRGLHFKWDPGFRFGVGYLFGHYDQWDIKLNWTHIHNTAHNHSGSDDGTSFYFPNWYPGLLGSFSTEASAHWSVTLNTLDLELGRSYFSGKALALRPLCGLRAAMIRQHYKASFNAPSTFKAHNYFTGGGLRAGADLLWHFSSHWLIFGKFSGSLIYGRFDVDERGSFEAFAFSTQRNLHRVRANLEAFLGLQYETDIFHGKSHISYSLGYELSEWFQQNQLVQIQAVVNPGGASPFIVAQENGVNGNLDFQGVTFKLQYQF